MSNELIKSSTNSPLGSYHWYHTILSKIKNIGEYLKDHYPENSINQKWGEDVFNLSKELIEGYTLINLPNGEATEVSENKQAK